MSSSENEYLLQNKPSISRKAVFIGVAIGVLVVCIITTFVLSLAALITAGRSSSVSSTNLFSDNSWNGKDRLRMTSEPISKEVCETFKVIVELFSRLSCYWSKHSPH